MSLVGWGWLNQWITDRLLAPQIRGSHLKPLSKDKDKSNTYTWALCVCIKSKLYIVFLLLILAIHSVHTHYTRIRVGFCVSLFVSFISSFQEQTKGLYWETKLKSCGYYTNGEKSSWLHICSFRPRCNVVIPHVASLSNHEAPQQDCHRHQYLQSPLLGRSYDGGKFFCFTILEFYLCLCGTFLYTLFCSHVI